MSAPIRVVPAGSSTHEPGDDAAPGSVLDALRRAAAEQTQERALHLPIGGAFGPHLLARYRVLSVDELQRFQGFGGKLTEINVAIEMMVTTCTTLVWVDEHGDRTELGVAYEPRLWDVMGWPLPDAIELDDLTPREVVVKLFGGNGSALAVHLERLSRWLQDPSGGVSPGESLAAT